ncbi:glycosyltransferase [Paenibacillus pasadenensis]|uniref:glycosyltransferase n=1 Tax=Paenibacillus pasadenensis TaxID=217090 RepID=UPI00203ADA84|nr:glycosyltransferase [Paenibacillus pasadenensis]MCM3747734.1 glycosyltransferase [Paenibacillus pasadenensis]
MTAFFTVVTGLLALQLCFVWWNRKYYVPLGEEAPLGIGASSTRKAAASNSAHTSSNLDLTSNIKKSNSKYSEVLPSDISILIPARNEERNISGCLESLLALREPPLEIIVLDDHSDDGTAILAGGLAARPESRIRLLQGSELPAGWLGKSYACSQLAAASRGRWLLFIDADVRLEPHALEAAALAASSQGRGLISGFPRQQTGTWLEKLAVPMMMFTILCHLPLKLVGGSSDPRFAAANGAFILMQRDSYRLTGGHAAVRSSLLDDMELIRQAKRCGEPVRLAQIDRHSSMRMYRSAPEVWAGYRKNLFPGMGRNPLLLAFVAMMYSLLYVAPAAGLVAAAAAMAAGSTPGWAPWAAAAWVLGALIKLSVDRISGLPVWHCLLLPMSITVVLLIGFDSAWRHYRRKGYEWKGRRYA